MTLSLVPPGGSAPPAGPSTDKTDPGACARKTIYVPEELFDTANAELKRLARRVHRVDRWELWASILDMVLDDPDALIPYVEKYKKARSKAS